MEGSIEWIHVIGLLHAARRGGGGGGIGEEERKTRGLKTSEGGWCLVAAKHMLVRSPPQICS